LRGYPLACIVFSLFMVILGHLIPLFADAIPSNLKIGDHNYEQRIEEAKKELYGWQELGDRLTQEINAMPDPGRTFVITHSYRVASHLRFLIGTGYQTRTTGHGVQNQYLIWDELDSLRGWNAIYFEKERKEEDPELLQKIFDRVDPMEELEIIARNGKTRRFYIIRCYGYKAKYINIGGS
jgi:hypothetical protein